jgi:DNA-binding response OmpR family regulator
MATRVLLIEDDPRIQEIVDRGLTPRGFVITCASDGPSGVDLAITADLQGVAL